MKKQILVPGIIAAMTVSVVLGGCGGNSGSGSRGAIEESREPDENKEEQDKKDEGSAKDPDIGDIDADNEVTVDKPSEEHDALKEAYSIYLEYLLENKDTCRMMEGLGFDPAKRPDISFSDVAGDDIPEMIYTEYTYFEDSTGTVYNAEMRIAGIKDGKVADLSQQLGGMISYSNAARNGYYLLFKTDNSKELYCVEESYDKYMISIKENASGNLEMEQLYAIGYWMPEEGEIPEETLLQRDELFSRASEIVYYIDYINEPVGAWYDAPGTLYDEAQMFPKTCKYIGMTYDEAIAWLKAQTGEAGSSTDASQDNTDEALGISFTWDVSTVTVFDDVYDPTSPAQPDADSCDLNVIISIADYNDISVTERADGVTEYRDNNGELILEAVTEQSGNEKTFSCKLYSSEHDLEIYAESVALVNGLPTYPVSACIDRGTDGKEKLSAEDMMRRSYTSTWFYGICRCENGVLSAY